MRINERLNLVLMVDRADGTTAYVHCTPISRDVFDQHFLVLTKTLTGMYELGFGPAMCTRMAGRMLKKTAQEMGVWEGPAGIQTTLWPEIRRLSNAVLASPRGWETMPYDDAVARNAFDAEDVAAVENAQAFFTAASWVHTMKELASDFYPLLPTSALNSTAFAASLMTSTQDDPSGATAAPALQATITEPGQPTRTLSVPS